jgi:hypothetical protein
MTTPGSDTLSYRADVVTDAPERYAKQLVAHLGRKVAFVDAETPAGPGSTVEIGSATGSVVPGDGVLVLLASGNDADDVARAQHVLGSHLERFGQRAELLVTWQPDASA